MSSLSQSGSETDGHPITFTPDIHEGDWAAYQLHSHHSYGKDFVCLTNSLTAYRQQCALAYLGKRAQIHGGVCNKMQSRIFSSRFLMELDDTNKKQRFSRYPWLEKLIDLVAEIEREQGNVSLASNVISLNAAVK